MNGVVAADLFVARAPELCMPEAGSCYDSTLEAERGETSASSSSGGLFFASCGVFHQQLMTPYYCFKKAVLYNINSFSFVFFFFQKQIGSSNA